MRYEKFMHALEHAKLKYEGEIRRILRDMAAGDAEVERAILRKPNTVKSGSARGVWTAARRAKQSRLMKARMRAKYGHGKA